MMKKSVLPKLITVMALGLTMNSARAAEEELAPPRPRPNLEELRERFKSLSPEQRQKLLREFRERRGPGGTNRSEWESFRDGLRQLPPEQREARIRELRRRLDQMPPHFRVLSSEEREAKRQQLKERVATQISQLRAKKDEGTITETEQRRLERMEEMAKRLEKGTLLGPRGAPPATGLPAPGHSNTPSLNPTLESNPTTPANPPK